MKKDTDLTLEKVTAADGVVETLKADAKVEVPTDEAKPYKKILKKIEVAPMQFEKTHMERQGNKLRQRLCGNGVVTVTEAGKADNPQGIEAPYYVLEVDQGKCQNQRRNSSKYCQACSDAHKIVSEDKTTA